MKIPILLIILSLASTTHLSAQTNILPQVRKTYNQMQPGAASGKTIREIIPPESVHHIALTRNRGKGAPLTLVFHPDWDSDQLFQYAFASDAKARALALSATEGTLAEYTIVTKGGDLYFIEVMGDHMRNIPITAVILRGDGFGCRFDIEYYMEEAEQGVPGYRH